MTVYTRLVSSLLFPLHERLKRHDTLAVLAELERTQWLAPDDLRAEQERRLAAFMQRVSTTVPWFQTLFAEHGWRAADFDTIDSLARLPLTDKTTLRTHAADWQARDADRLIVQRTSGSTGEPLEFRLSRHRVSMDIAAKWRATRWWGVDFGDPEVVLWGSAIETSQQDRLRAWRDALFRSRLEATHELTRQGMTSILQRMRAKPPKMVFGYPSALARLARHAMAHGPRADDIGIHVAFCTSEVLRPEWREAIAAGFACGVANEYGARDAGFIARECPHGGLHITAEEVIVEIVDEAGKPVLPGQEGDIVVTNLAGPEFPFIRYRTGDRGRLDPTPCPCGRGLPLLAEVSGRANDGLLRADGAWVHGSAVNHCLRDVPGLQAYRVMQNAVDEVELQLVLEGQLDAALRTRLETLLRQLLGNTARVQILQTDTIPPLPNGKFRHIICNVPQVPESGPASPLQRTITESVS